MSITTDSLIIKTIHWWEKNILNRPWLLIVSFFVASGLVGKYTMDNLTVNTNTADMISTQLPFQQNRIKLEKSFPQDIDTVLLLIEGNSPEQTSAVVNRIARELRENKDVVKSVYVPGEGDFFDRNGMLYLSLKELEKISKQLVNAQPFIGKLSKDNSLHGLVDILVKPSKPPMTMALNWI